jgi:hypothetical protein
MGKRLDRISWSPDKTVGVCGQLFGRLSRLEKIEG